MSHTINTSGRLGTRVNDWRAIVQQNDFGVMKRAKHNSVDSRGNTGSEERLPSRMEEVKMNRQMQVVFGEKKSIKNFYCSGCLYKRERKPACWQGEEMIQLRGGHCLLRGLRGSNTSNTFNDVGGCNTWSTCRGICLNLGLRCLFKGRNREQMHRNSGR